MGTWVGADDRIRTCNFRLGRTTLYQLSYIRLYVLYRWLDLNQRVLLPKSSEISRAPLHLCLIFCSPGWYWPIFHELKARYFTLKLRRSLLSLFIIVFFLFCGEPLFRPESSRFSVSRFYQVSLNTICESRRTRTSELEWELIYSQLQLPLCDTPKFQFCYHHFLPFRRGVFRIGNRL